MRKNKAGIVTVAVLAILIVIGVFADYIFELNRFPKYEHGEIVSVKLMVWGGVDGRDYEHSAYKVGDEYKYEYNNKKKYTKQVFDLSEKDYEKLIKNDFHELLGREPENRYNGSDEIHVYTVIRFEDGYEKEIEGTDYSISTFFRACSETFLES